jgi:hypothetical protein
MQKGGPASLATAGIILVGSYISRGYRDQIGVANSVLTQMRGGKKFLEDDFKSDTA